MTTPAQASSAIRRTRTSSAMSDVVLTSTARARWANRSRRRIDRALSPSGNASSATTSLEARSGNRLGLQHVGSTGDASRNGSPSGRCTTAVHPSSSISSRGASVAAEARSDTPVTRRLRLRRAARLATCASTWTVGRCGRRREACRRRARSSRRSRQLPVRAASRAAGRSSSHRSARCANSRDRQANDRPLRMRHHSGANSGRWSRLACRVALSSPELRLGSTMCQGRADASTDRSLITGSYFLFTGRQHVIRELAGRSMRRCGRGSPRRRCRLGGGWRVVGAAVGRSRAMSLALRCAFAWR